MGSSGGLHHDADLGIRIELESLLIELRLADLDEFLDGANLLDASYRGIIILMSPKALARSKARS